MVSVRCKLVVKKALRELGLHYVHMKLGEVDIRPRLTEESKQKLNERLRSAGLELMNNRKVRLIEAIKVLVIESVHYSDELPKVNFSAYLSEKLQHNYTYLSNIFSRSEGTTIEKFIIAHKIERVKALLAYNELNLTEIARKMQYSSVAHLSGQFKKITGYTASGYRKLSHKQRITLENV